MQNFRNAGFIKSYPALLHLPITVSEKSLIELVLSFTDKGNLFYMNYKDIAPYLSFSNVQSVKNVISNLRRKGYINTKQSYNFNGSTGGSSTSIEVNQDLINNQLKEFLKESNINTSKGINSNSSSVESISNSEEKNIEFDVDKMFILSQKNQFISSLINANIPNKNDYESDIDFYNEVKKRLIIIFNSEVLKRDDLKEFYQNIKVDK